MEQQIMRGDIYFANLNPVVGSEQGDTRPVLVVQNDVGNKHSPTIVIIPITGNLSKNPLPTHVLLNRLCGLDHESLALAEQIRTIDRSRIGNYIGHIPESAFVEVDRALSICVGLCDKPPKKPTPLVLSLCHRCENDFRDAGYLLVKKGWQEIMEPCDFCGRAKGLNFGLFQKKSA